MIQSLRKKFILINMLLVFIVLVIVFSAFCVSSHQQVVTENQAALRMALNRKDGGRAPIMEIGKTPPGEFIRSPVFIVQLDSDGGIASIIEENISVSEDYAAKAVVQALASGQSEGTLREHNLRFLISTDRGQSRLAFLDQYDEDIQLRNSIVMSVTALCGALLGFFLISLFLSKWVLRPVEQSWQQQRRFVADASHELKTPLTVILANLGIIKSNREETVESQLKWITSTEAEADRMKLLVENLLFLAKSDDALAPVVFHEVNFSDLVYSDSLAFESLAYERQLTINADHIEPELKLQGSESQLRQLVSILIDNAIKYSKPRSGITVSLSKRQARLYLSVNNQGKPLSQEVLAHLFDRFYRADSSRSEDGYGLGLSIAKSIAEIHQGKIGASSNEKDGTTFVVELRQG